jgi:DmsE family decaheme c-type cytochrome
MRTRHVGKSARLLIAIGAGASFFLGAFASAAEEKPASPHGYGKGLAQEIAAYLTDNKMITPSAAPAGTNASGMDLAAAHKSVPGYGADASGTDLAAAHKSVPGYGSSADASGTDLAAAHKSVPGYGSTVPANDGLARDIAKYLAAPDEFKAEQSTWVKVAAAKVPAPPSAPVQRLAAAQVPVAMQPASLEQGYAGQATCVACHTQESQNWAHTIHAKVFDLNPRNELERTGCEACHGPGAAHAQNPTAPLSIVRFSRRSQNPIEQQNGQCLNCHSGGQRIFWQASAHETRDLGCADCHNPMAAFSTKGLQARASINETCMGCHRTQRTEFRRRSHMPLFEGKVGCVDCHNPHGSTTAPLLKADSVNENCYNCHAEKRGPFLFEHAPVRDNCVNCHSPHGSNYEKLLVVARPILCQQCHEQANNAQGGHVSSLQNAGNLGGGPVPDVRTLGRSCINCHSQIHGSNSPSGAKFER